MTKLQKTTGWVASLIFAVGTFLFFRFSYTYHVHYQEQMQMFEFSVSYFSDTVRVPGGVADYAGRFLTQFFYYANAGAAIIALLLLLLQRLVLACCRRRDGISMPLSFLPSACCLIFFCDENSLTGAVVALLLASALALAVTKIQNSKLRTAAGLAGVILVYMLCGPLAVVYLFIAFRGLGIWRALLGVALFAGCILVSPQIFHYPLGRLACGVHYFRFHNFVPFWIWAGAFTFVAVLAVSAVSFRENLQKRWWSLGAGLVVAAGTIFGVYETADFRKEEIFKYDFMSRFRMWNRIMLEADRKAPSDPLSVSCLNLALSMSGRIQDSMFEYYQNGPQGLVPSYVKETETCLCIAQIYYFMGMVNAAQRFAFEAQEAIPDFQKSARCYEMLVLTNIVNEDYEVARKYNNALRNTLFYSERAAKYEGLLYNDTAITRFQETFWLRSVRMHSRDFLYSEKEMDSMLGLLYMDNTSNRMALDYLLAWTLLRKDIPRFRQYVGLYRGNTLPKVYQEAMMLDWINGGNTGGYPEFVRESVAQRFNEFSADRRNGADEGRMQEKYGDTYWFYYLYRNNQ